MKEKMTLSSKTIGLEMEYFESGKVERSTLYDENGIRINSYKYYDNGQISDSLFYNEKNIIDSAFHYFENGKLRAIYYLLKGNKKDSLFAFNSKGENLINVVYFKEAQFKNGENDWRNYIKENLNPNIPIDNGAPKGEYTVVVCFTIGKDGLISDVKVNTNHGYGMEEGVIKMIKNSPNWVPEVFLGEKLSVYRRQPVTYYVDEK